MTNFYIFLNTVSAIANFIAMINPNNPLYLFNAAVATVNTFVMFLLFYTKYHEPHED